MSSGSPTRKKRTTGLAIAAILLIITLAGLFLLRSHLDGALEDYLGQLVTERSGGTYELQLGNLSVGLLAGRAELQKVRLRPADTTLSAPELGIRSATLSGFRLLPFLFQDEFYLDEIRLSGPELKLTQGGVLPGFTGRRDGRGPTADLAHAEIGRILIEEGTLSYFRPDSVRPHAEITDLSVLAEGIDFESDSASGSIIPKFSQLIVETGEVQFEGKSGMYTLSAGGARFSLTENDFRIDSLRLTPNYPKYRFSRLHGHQVDRMELDVGQIRLSGLDIDKLFTGEVAGSRIDVRQADFDVFRSKELPRGPRRQKEFPHVAFMSLPLPVSVDTVAILGSNIRYTEHHVGVSQPGTVTFLNTNGTLLNLTNKPSSISRNHIMTLDLTTQVMGSSMLIVGFEFPMGWDGRHTARGTLQSMAVSELNPILEPVGLVRAERGQIHSMDFFMYLHPDRATGWVELVYSDLRIDLLRPENVDDGRYRRLVSWMANSLMIRDDNDQAPYRRGEVSFQRIERKSVFNYWWKSLSSGLKDNVGI